MADDLDRRIVPFGLVFLGIVVVALGAFLPIWDEGSVTFSSIASNTLVQSGNGWLTLILCAGSVVSLLRTLQAPRRIYWPFISGILVIAWAVWTGTNNELLTLCPIDATAGAAGCQIADPGLGIYVTGLGGVALLVGGWFCLRLPRLRELESEASSPQREP